MNHHQLEANYNVQIAELKEDLKLKAKCEIHEIEERKNQHVNDLIFNHREAFDQIKSYYNGVYLKYLSYLYLELYTVQSILNTIDYTYSKKRKKKCNIIIYGNMILVNDIGKE